MKRFLLLLLLLTLLRPGSVFADEAKPMAEDPALEERVMKLAEELRCLVCQNETLAASQADLAVDLRRQIREQMRQGKSDAEIKEYLTQRYGDFVLYRPPVKSTTYLLWFGPFILLGVGGVVQYLIIKRRRERIQEQPLSAAERKRVEALLDENWEKKAV